MNQQESATTRSRVVPTAARLALAVTMLAGMFGALPPVPTLAATITVINTNDSGPGSLRQAVIDAGAGDTIDFVLTLPATITLTSGEIVINKNLTISGPGAESLTVSGNNNSRVFYISSAGATVNISGLTLSEGSSANWGGCIENEGTLFISDCVITDCSANGAGNGYGGGIDNYNGTVNITHCTVSGNTANDEGGGIYTYGGTVTITESAVSDNTSDNAGGIASRSAGTVTLVRSTVDSNYATVGSNLFGGGILSDGGTLTISDSTISGNVAVNGGGGIIDGAAIALNITSSTLVSNTSTSGGGGLHLDVTTAVLSNTILAYNTGGGGNNFYSASTGSITSVGYNLESLNEAGLSATGDITNTDPLLAPLADNGGPTWTHAPTVGSPAIDAGSCAGPTDQRGRPRPLDHPSYPNAHNGCDIGSYEASVPQTDLSISKSVNTPTALPGEMITYTVAFSNSSSITATSVIITDSIPISVTNTSVISSGVSITHVTGTRYVWTLPSLEAGQGGIITISGVLSDPLPYGHVFTNTVTIASTTVETDTVDNTSSAPLRIPYVELVIDKTVSPLQAVAGESITYTITITNVGTDPVSVPLSDTLHPSVTLAYVDQTDSNAYEFNAGTHVNTEWYDSRPGDYGDEWLRIQNTALFSGTFTSRVIDAHNVVTWTSLAWEPRRPTWKPLPDYGQEELYYDLGNVDMLDNRILYHLDDPPGPVLADTSGWDNHGYCPAIAGESCPTAGAVGRFNSALSFNGALSQTVATSDALIPDQFAVEMWVYPTVIGDTSLFLRTDNASTAVVTYSHLLGIKDGRFQFVVLDDAYQVISGTTLIAEDTWYHVAATVEDEGEMRLYVDGVEEARGEVEALWQGGGWYRLGSAFGGGSEYYSGLMDEVAVYTRTLSYGEVIDHYLRGALRLSFQVRSCSTPACAVEGFVGPDGTAGTFYSEQSYTGVAWPGYPGLDLENSVASNRYFQYRATLQTDNPEYSPGLLWVWAGPDHHAVIPSQGNCETEPSRFDCEMGELGSSETATVTVHAVVDEAALGIITNTAFVTPTFPSDNPLDNWTQVTATVSSEVCLSIGKYDGDYNYHGDLRWGHPHGARDPVEPSGTITYVLEVHNGGPSTAWDVEITDALPMNVTDVFAHGDWASCGQVGNTITCNADSLDAWSWQHIVVVGTAPTTPGVITNTAWVTALASYVIPECSHISDTETTTIEPLADLVVTKEAVPNVVDPGAVITFVVDVTNDGPSPAQNIELLDVLQEGYTAHTTQGPWSCTSLTSNVVSCTLAYLDVGATASIVVTTTAPLTGSVVNLANVWAETTDLCSENNEVKAYAIVRPVADLHISKQDWPDPVYAGNPLTYTLLVTNTGYVPVGEFTTTLRFENDKYIRIRSHGRAQGYPSNLHVGGIVGVIADMSVQIHGFAHDYPSDVSILLVGPDEQGVVLMSNTGGDTPVSDLILTFDDAGESMPISEPLTTTVYRPSNYGLGREFYPPAPEGPYGGSLADLNGHDPNGLWRLYVMDTVASEGGEILNGWSMSFTITTVDVVTVTDDLPPGLTGVGSAPPTGWACGVLTDSLECTSSYLPVSTPVSITVTATAPITPGVITNSVTITSSVVDFWPESNQDTITTTVIGMADLGIAKLVDPAGTVFAGYPITFTLVVSNSGPSPVPTATVTDTLPDGLTGVSAPGCDISALPQMTCTVYNLIPFSPTNIVIMANAPITPGVITNTAGVTSTVRDDDPLNNTAWVTITVAEQPIAGLQAFNDSPTELGSLTSFSATVTAGTNISYVWAFGDGSTGYGVSPGHTYPATGTFTAIVTATNSVSSAWVTTTVIITPSISYDILMPWVMRNWVAAPDLVVESIIAASNAVTVVIRNAGHQPVTNQFANEFWVDVYINPYTPPTQVNQTWEFVGSQGLVWGVIIGALPLDPGDTITLTVDSDPFDEPYFWPDLSNVTWPLAPGTQLYAQVDSSNAETTYGGVLENHEVWNGIYNNISGPQYVRTGRPAMTKGEYSLSNTVASASAWFARHFGTAHALEPGP